VLRWATEVDTAADEANKPTRKPRKGLGDDCNMYMSTRDDEVICKSRKYYHRVRRSQGKAALKR
jgi:hypothetical protein